MATTDPLTAARLPELTDGEVEAIAAGAAWYAKYHQRDLRTAEDDPSAAATVRREHFADLFSALEKLGVRMRRPDAIADR